MVERNLIREGFVYNTLTPLGTISGSQVVIPSEIDRLADGDLSTTALTVTGTKFISLDADLGARFKIKRVELYTSETSNSNFSMSTSDDGGSFIPVTMTGSTGLYVSQAGRFDTTASGSPRYFRYEHRPSVDTPVQEWNVVSDDTYVDFGSDGSLTQVDISDAPVGRPSDHITTLSLFNRFNSTAEGFVFIDRTDNDAESQIEVALNPNGPWFGRSTSTSLQPTVTEWERGTFSNTRVVPSGVFSLSFSDGSTHGWSAIDATVSSLDGALHGSSTGSAPLVRNPEGFQSLRSNTFYQTETTTFANFFTFRAKDADRVRVRLRVSSAIPSSSLVSGAQLFWRNQDNDVATVPPVSNSTFPIGGSRPPTGGVDTLEFDVGSVPTWSGTIRSLWVRPFTVSTGTGFQFDLYDVAAHHTAGDRVTLDFRPVNSGTFADTSITDIRKFTIDSNTADATDTRTFLSTRHTVMQDCIITRVRWFAKGGSTTNNDAIFLARPTTSGSFPSAGSNFTVPHAIRLGDLTLETDALYREIPVFWSAQKGDIIGASTQSFSTAKTQYSISLTSPNASFRSPTGITTTDLSSMQTGLNSLSNWVATTRTYLIGYDAIPNELVRKDGTSPYQTTGTYRTPVFDAGVSPAMAQLSFSSIEPSGTSIDSLGGSGFKTIRARASDIPPKVSLGLGEAGYVAGTDSTLFLHLNDAKSLALAQDSPYQINTHNFEVAARESTGAVPNFGGAILYHQPKDELWVLNCIISGTSSFTSTDVRPTWDRFEASTGNYIATQKVDGNITYGYTHSSTNPAHAFEPVGFVADYGRDDIYIYFRDASASVGAGTYHGIITDTNGVFKDVFWRADTVGADSEHLNSIIALTYAPKLQVPVVQVATSGIFFTLASNSTSNVLPGLQNKGLYIAAYRNGRDTDPRGVSFINEKAVQSIPGLGFAINPPDARGVVYNEQTGLLNLLFDSRATFSDDSDSKGFPLVMTLHPSFNSSNSTFEYTVVGSGLLSPSSSINVDGYTRTNAGTDADWSGSRNRYLSGGNEGTCFTMGMAHNTRRDTLVLLRNYTATFSDFFPNSSSPGHLTGENHSFITEVGAGSAVEYGAPRSPLSTDPIWGTTSGTLQFTDISTEGFNFPTGRYVQVEYQLNGDIINRVTPTLISSHITQGLRVGQVGPNSTKDIYLRTNIPENQPIGDQLGRLKVYWETVE
jgi:hypothetical protein